MWGGTRRRKERPLERWNWSSQYSEWARATRVVRGMKTAAARRTASQKWRSKGTDVVRAGRWEGAEVKCLGSKVERRRIAARGRDARRGGVTGGGT
jgi:hypothetical protein